MGRQWPALDGTSASRTLSSGRHFQRTSPSPPPFASQGPGMPAFERRSIVQIRPMVARLVAKMRFEKIARANCFGRQLFKPQGTTTARGRPRTAPDPCKFIGFGHQGGRKPCKFTGFPAALVPKPYEFTRIWGGPWAPPGGSGRYFSGPHTTSVAGTALGFF